MPGFCRPSHIYTYAYTYIYIYILAKVPALSCRLGHVPYDHAFGFLTGGYAPYDLFHTITPSASHGWLCSIRSRLRRSHSALLIHYKKVELKKKINLHRIRTCICLSRVGCVTTAAQWTINFTENKCSIYYQLCLGCSLQECR